MTYTNSLFLCFISLVHIIVASNTLKNDEKVARDFLESLNKKTADIISKLVDAEWEFETQNSVTAEEELFQATSEAVKNAKGSFHTVLASYPWMLYSDPDIRRQLKLYSEIGMLALPEEKYDEFQKIIFELEHIQENTTVCDYYNRTKCDLYLRPDIQQKLETSLNYEEISYLWSEWNELTESKVRKLLNDYVNLTNEAAVFNNYKSYKEYSLRNVEEYNLKQEMENLWESVKPLYDQIHAYVRRKLRDIYGEKIIPQKGSIPAQLLGDIWCENWGGIIKKLMPFPEKDDTNITEVMINKSYTQESVRNLAENYFISLNFTVPDHLWYNETSKINIEKVCHPKIFNFYNNKIRIKDCGRISLAGYFEDIRLLAEAEYMLQYAHQPFIYRIPADPGLEMAVSDLLTLSASTFGNLKNIGLYSEEISEKVRLNRLFKIALEKITSIPFLMVQEYTRWDIFSGKSVDDTLKRLHELREKYQGISAVANEFSFNSKGIGSVFSEISLVHRFFSYFLQFQLYEFFCPESEKLSMDECSFIGKVEVRDTLRYIMSLGSSKSSKEVRTILLGEDKIKSESILNYFKPLMSWLKAENEKAGEFVGWNVPEKPKEIESSKKIRKRYVDYYSDEKENDSDMAEPDRFQRFVHKRSKSKLNDIKKNENKLKSNEKKLIPLIDQQNHGSSFEGAARQSHYAGKHSLKEESENEMDKNSENLLRLRNNKAGSFGHKKRQLDYNSFNTPRESSYKSITGKEVDNSELPQRFTSRNGKSFADLEFVRVPYDGSNVYVRTKNEEKGNNEMYNIQSSKSEKRHSFVAPYDHAIIQTWSIGTDDDYETSNKIGSLKNSRRSDYASENLKVIGESSEREKSNENLMKTKRQMLLDSFDNSYIRQKTHSRSLSDEEESFYKKENEYGKNRNNEDSESINSNDNNNNGESGNVNNIKPKRRAWENQRQRTGDENKIFQSHSISRRNDKIQRQNEMLWSPEWHSQTKKDISKFLHSIGFTNENDDKFKTKELKKKLKEDLRTDLEHSDPAVLKGEPFENRAKFGIGRSDAGIEKEANKFWATKNYLTENEKMMQSPSGLKKKNDMLNSELQSSLLSKSLGGMTMGNKQMPTNGESGTVSKNQEVDSNLESHILGNFENRHSGLNEPQLQDFLPNNYQQNHIFLSKPGLEENKFKNDLNKLNQQRNEGKGNSDQYLNEFAYKYVPVSDKLEYEQKKDFSLPFNYENNKSPYIIIVGELTPEMREKLLKEKETTSPDLGKQYFQGASNIDEKKLSDKRSRGSNKIYIIPVDLKSSQLNLLKPNLYAEHEHDAGHGPNTERDEESEEEQLHLEDNSKLEERTNLYKTGKENPSEFILSWNNDKNRKIVKRSKREHDKQSENDALRLLRLASTKNPFLRSLLGRGSEYPPFANENFYGPARMQTMNQQFISSNELSTPSANEYPQASGTSVQHEAPNFEEASAKEDGGIKSFPKDQKEDLPLFINSGLPYNNFEKKEEVKLYSDDNAKAVADVDIPNKEDTSCCKKIILTSPPKCPCPCPCSCPCPYPMPCPLPCPCTCAIACPPPSKPSNPCPPSPPSPSCPPNPPCPCPDICCKKPSECSLVNCQFKITKAKKPHERLTIMIYDRINPPAELPEPYDALAVISEILQRIQCCSCKPSSQLTEEDPDYPANDNMDQLRENTGQHSENKVKESTGKISVTKNEDQETVGAGEGIQNTSQGDESLRDGKLQSKGKVTPAIDQLTVFSKDKLKPVFIELHKIEDMLRKRNEEK